MKINKIMFLTIVLLAILSLGAVSAQDDLMDNVASDDAAISHETVQLDSADTISSDDDTQSKYVETTGDDSSEGNQKSPYATINKAISEVNASQKAVIYLGEGTFSGENNTDLSIDLAHKQNGGSLTIIGKGDGKTIIDANYEAPIFKSISADSVVSLINITFIHGKNNVGSAITTSGDLTIDTCEFIKNEASAYAAVYQKEVNNLKVTNSRFKDNIADSGNAAIYYSAWGDTEHNVTIIGSVFENSTTTYSWADSSCVYIQAGNILVQGNTFANISGTGKGTALNVRGANSAKVVNNVFKDSSYDGTDNERAVLYIADVCLEGNTFENCTTHNGAPIYSLLDFNSKIVFDDLLVEGTSFELTAKLTDDKGNLVNSYGGVSFYLNDQKIGSAKATSDGIATLSVSKLLNNGVYTLTGSYGEDKFDCNVTNATVNVNFDHSPIELWISPSGNDTGGDGSSAKPFKTIKHALDYGLENHVEVIVHLLNGLYNETGDFALSYSDVAKISLVGESKEGAIISGNSNNVFLTAGVNTEVLLKNLTIKDLTGYNSFNIRYATFENCIVDNVKRVNAQTSPSRVVFRNVHWTNSENFVVYNGEIYDSYFENITSSGTGNFWLATTDDSHEIIVENSKFINLTCTGNSGIGVLYVQGNFRSINNTFDSNKATKNNGVIYVSGNKIVSINDTFTNNHADGNYGVGTFFTKDDNPICIIENAKFINNTADDCGAIGLYGGELINCTFENNTAKSNGGAIYAPTHLSSVKFYELTLTGVTFKNNNAKNGKDIFIAPSTDKNNFISVLPNITVTFNDLTTKELFDTVSVDVTHESGAIIGGGIITFTLGGSRIGEADLINGHAEFGYLGFEDGIYNLSGSWNNAVDDTKYVKGTVEVTLNELDDNVTLYVSDVKGNDETADGSLEKPYKTIDAALEFGYTKSKVIIINILEGNYTGLGNTNITTFSSLNITIVGEGKDKTVIDGENKNWFMKILAGKDGSISLYNMTLVNMSTNYVQNRAIGTSAITTENAELLVDGVNFIACHGNNGGAILAKGTLTVLNSYFFNNGDSEYGGAINCEGKLIIDNCEFVANHAKWGSTVYSTGELYFTNSIVQDSMRVNGMSGDAVAIGTKGNITIINATIYRTGKTCAELIGTGHTWNDDPYFAVGVTAEHLKIINSTIDGYSKSYNSQFANSGAISPSVSWNTAYRSPDVLEVYNTKFLNVFTVMAGTNGESVFDNCYFENITNFATTGLRITVSGNVEVKNSYFKDGTFTITKVADSNFTFNNNWWGDNEQPTYKEANVNTHPDTWLILTLNATEEGNAVLAFKSFDGENVTDYDGAVYAREFAIEAVNATLKVNNGTISNSVVIPLETGAEGIYVNATVDGQQVNLTRMIADISAKASPVHVGQNVVVEITNPADLKGNITVIIGDREYSSVVTGEKTNITIPDLVAGNYTASVVFNGDDTYLAKTISVDVKVIDIIIKASDVEKYFKGSQKLNVTVVDGEGNILAGEKIVAVIGNETLQATTDANGIAVFDLDMAVGNYVAEISLNTTKATVNIVIKSTVPASSNDTVINVDNGFETTIMDSEGKPLANTTVTLEIDGKKVNKTTDENGVVRLTKEEIGEAGTNHTITVINPVTNETVTYDVNSTKPAPAPTPTPSPTPSPVVKQTIVLKAYKKTVKIKKTAKKLVLKATLKINGKKVKGKIIKFKFKGKTYKGKTNKNGIAKVTIKKKVIKKLKKGKKYTVKITYGKKSVKMVVKVKK